MKRFLTTLSLLLSTAVVASPCETVGVHALSFHDKAGYNTFTPGIYCKTASGWTAGMLRNSEGRFGAYAGKTFETQSKAFAVTLGGITGYESAVTPLVVPSLLVPNTGVRLSWLSKVPKTKGASALHISYEMKF
jgi:hypothetical protein